MLVNIKPLSTFPKLHSDTLFGALLSAINELYPDKVEYIIDKFEEGKPPFLISSTFPVLFNEDENIRFYPKLIINSDLTDINPKTIKEYKKVEFIDETLFKSLINGEMSEKELLENYDKYYKYSNLLMSKNPDVDFGFGKNILPNNSVNRLVNDTKIFYTQGDSYKNLGLFFLIKIFENEFEDILKSALKFLKDRGFGRDISTGKGQFDYNIETEDLINNDENGNMFTTLSRFIPSSDDLKRVRGRRGLDILNIIQKELDIEVQITEKDFDDIPEVDSKLLKLAQVMNGKVVTNDYNLNKVAQFQGVEVLNINELANAVKPVAIPGEEMVAQVVKEGKESNQGIAYLDDGTMIVVEGGKKHIGETINVLVTSVLQTSAGRMIFGKPKN